MKLTIPCEFKVTVEREGNDDKSIWWAYVDMNGKERLNARAPFMLDAVAKLEKKIQAYIKAIQW